MFRIPVPSEETTDIDTFSVNIDCVACRTHLINTVNIPCQHAVFCVTCAREYVRRKTKAKKPVFCPACYTILTAINVIYLHYTPYKLAI